MQFATFVFVYLSTFFYSDFHERFQLNALECVENKFGLLNSDYSVYISVFFIVEV